MTNIVFKILNDKLISLRKKKEELEQKLYFNPYKEMVEITKEFKSLLKEFGGGSKEVANFVEDKHKQEKYLMKIVKEQIDNNDKWMGDLVKVDTDIWHLSRELSSLNIKGRSKMKIESYIVLDEHYNEIHFKSKNFSYRDKIIGRITNVKSLNDGKVKIEYELDDINLIQKLKDNQIKSSSIGFQGE